MDTSTDEIATATTALLDGTHAKLRNAFPFMRSEDLKAAVDKVTAQLQHELRLLEPASTVRKTQFDFNQLPAEIRIYIYELALAREDSDPFEIQKSCGRLSSANVLPSPFPAVLHINRQIRQEALPIFYQITTFSATFPYLGTIQPDKAAQLWLDLIGADFRLLIQRLDVRFLGMFQYEVEDCIDEVVEQNYPNELHRRCYEQDLLKRHIVDTLKLDQEGVRYGTISVWRQEGPDQPKAIYTDSQDGSDDEEGDDDSSEDEQGDQQTGSGEEGEST